MDTLLFQARPVDTGRRNALVIDPCSGHQNRLARQALVFRALRSVLRLRQRMDVLSRLVRRATSGERRAQTRSARTHTQGATLLLLACAASRSGAQVTPAGDSTLARITAEA